MRELRTDQDFDRVASQVCQSIAAQWVAMPDTWTQYNPAVDHRGCPCPSESANAVAWCAIGAITKRTMEAFPEDVTTRGPLAERITERVRMAENKRTSQGFTGLHQVNDHMWKTAADAAAAFDRAAKEFARRASK
jgi:hypothetical protein